MSDDSSWWPPGYTDPAFQVRRVPYRYVEGGDYVRGTTNAELVHTALRYPTQGPDWNVIEGKALLFTRPYDHQRIEIMWGWPSNIRDTWEAVSLVRSSFGFPSTPNDGQTAWYYERTPPNFPQAAPPPAVILDGTAERPLPAGRWYYYSLFFRVNPLDWIIGMKSATLLPRDFNHKNHLWDNIPPYYQWVDDNFREGAGFLRKFLDVFGFELDNTREFVESWQQLYHIDFAPATLLRHLGANFGVPFESGVGDIRYRGLLANLGFLYDIRGTAKGLEQVIENMSKYECDITAGQNLVLLPDDADFYFSTGNWGALHSDLNPDDVVGTNVTTLAPVNVLLTKNNPALVPPPAGFGRGSMRMITPFANATTDVMLACGDSETSDGKEFTPLFSGIPVKDGFTYGFSIRVKMASPSPVTLWLTWIGGSGDPDDLIDAEASPISTPAANTWTEFSVVGTAPANSVYMIPTIQFTARVAGAGPTWSPPVDVAGMMTFTLGYRGSVPTVAPDRYLTMGDPSERIGPSKTDFVPFLIGEKT